MLSSAQELATFATRLPVAPSPSPPRCSGGQNVGSATYAGGTTPVLVEVFVLLGGVVSRYVFHHPIIWSDELASTLFLWLAMLGSAMALHRSEHTRMTAFVGLLSPPVRLALDVVATFAGLAFLVMMLIGVFVLLLRRFPGFLLAVLRSPFISISVTDRRILWTLPWMKTRGGPSPFSR